MGVNRRGERRRLLAIDRAASLPVQTFTDLSHDLRRHLIRAVTPRQAHQRFPVTLAELLGFSVRVAGPADRQDHHRHVGPGDVGLKPRDRLMLPGLDPDQLLKLERLPEEGIVRNVVNAVRQAVHYLTAPEDVSGDSEVNSDIV